MKTGLLGMNGNLVRDACKGNEGTVPSFHCISSVGESPPYSAKPKSNFVIRIDLVLRFGF